MDTSTLLGAEVNGWKYPVSLVDSLRLIRMSEGKVNPIKSEAEREMEASFKASGDEASTAAERMSPLFASIYS